MSLPRVSQETIEAYIRWVESDPTGQKAVQKIREFDRENPLLVKFLFEIAEHLNVPIVDGRTGLEAVYTALQLEIDRGGTQLTESTLPIVSLGTLREIIQPPFHEVYRARMKVENPELDGYADTLHNMTLPLTRGTAGFIGGANACYTILRMKAADK